MRIETDLKISKETAKNFAMLIYDEMAKYIVSEKQSQQEIKDYITNKNSADLDDSEEVEADFD